MPVFLIQGKTIDKMTKQLKFHVELIGDTDIDQAKNRFYTQFLMYFPFLMFEDHIIILMQEWKKNALNALLPFARD